MKAGLLSLFYLSTILVGASALPSLRSLSVQREIAHIAYDEDNGQFLGFKRDGSLYGRYLAHELLVWRRSAGQCTNLTVDEAQSLPGWDVLEAYAKSNWGGGSWNIVTNPKEYPESPAVCVSDDPVKIELDVSGQHNRQCIWDVWNRWHSVTASSTRSPVGLFGESRRVFEPLTYLIAVSTLAISSTLGVSFGVPLLSADASVTVSKEVTNEQSSSFETSYSTVTTVTCTIDTKDGKTCSVDLKLHTCTAKSKGQIRYLATGWSRRLWFRLSLSTLDIKNLVAALHNRLQNRGQNRVRIATLTAPNDKTYGHYKYILPFLCAFNGLLTLSIGVVYIDDILSNEDDRSSFVEIQGPISTETRSSSNAVCV
ncbi:uncharacterized protein ARMOST_07414 [Armillaria ostoyae]|uniref:Autophagy-related protein 27 n=1 Tax=Armillaria ostoyae TaxID=47428 RepID=A0A284R5R3_ARMOS|nr:uncharacterized protein ARMOST_07414 [Armillaria ostoyae]